MRREIIRIGSEVRIEDGYLQIYDHYNYVAVFGKKYFFDVDGEEVFEGVRFLTIKELQIKAREADGKNHNFIFVEA